MKFSHCMQTPTLKMAGELWFRVHERDGRIARLWSALEPGELPG